MELKGDTELIAMTREGLESALTLELAWRLEVRNAENAELKRQLRWCWKNWGDEEVYSAPEVAAIERIVKE